MAAGVVVGGVLLASDELLGVEELTVGASADLVYSKSALRQLVVSQVRMLQKTSELLQHYSLHREHLNRKHAIISKCTLQMTLCNFDRFRLYMKLKTPRNAYACKRIIQHFSDHETSK